MDTIAHFNGCSDHKLIYSVRYAKNINRKPRYIRKRCFKNFDAVRFKNEIHNLKWLDIYLSTNVDTAVQKLTDRITTVLDKYAPVQTVQIRSRYAPWLSNATKQVMQQRNRAQQALLRSPDQEKSREYKNLRNRATNLIRKDKRSWESSKLNHLIYDSSSLWKNVKNILALKSAGPPKQLFHDGKLIGSPKELAEVMNEFFISKVMSLQDNLPPPAEDPLKYLKRLMMNRTCSLKFKSVHPDEVKKVVSSLKNSKSCGLDEIDVATLKLIIDDILPSLTHIINLSLLSSTFPKAWKVAKVVPLLKKGDHLCPKNYRPVALLPILSKVLEKIVFSQIVQYMETNSLLHPSHHGSRARHDTCTAVLEMHSTWIDAIEDGKMTGVMMLDLSAAFDLVNHDLLIKKLEFMGFQRDILLWFQNYLSERQQCVHIDGQTSDLLPVTVGVPQGSVLSALLYILFVNDLPEVIHHHETSNTITGQIEYNGWCDSCGSLCAYVDDSTYSCSSEDPNVLSEMLSSQYRKLACYFNDNRLVINDDKTKLIILRCSSKANQGQTIRVSAGR